MNRRLGIVAILVSAALQRAPAEQKSSALWGGHWKLDRAASHFVGVAVGIQHLPHTYRFDLGGTVITVGDDGKDYPTAPTRTTSFKQVAANQWRRVHKQNGKTLDTSIFTLASDQRSFLIHTVAVDDAGLKHVSDETFLRQSPGKGINGTWRSTKGGVNTAETIDIALVGNGAMRIDFPDQQMSLVTKLDGSAVPYTGARAVPSVRAVVSEPSPRVLHWTDLLSSQPYMQQTCTLSPDGHRLAVASWHVTSSQDKDEAIYTRQ